MSAAELLPAEVLRRKAVVYVRQSCSNREVGLDLDPDLRVQEVINQIFAKFRECGSAGQVLLRTSAERVHFPRPSDGKRMVALEWHPIRYRGADARKPSPNDTRGSGRSHIVLPCPERERLSRPPPATTMARKCRVVGPAPIAHNLDTRHCLAISGCHSDSLTLASCRAAQEIDRALLEQGGSHRTDTMNASAMTSLQARIAKRAFVGDSALSEAISSDRPAAVSAG